MVTIDIFEEPCYHQNHKPLRTVTVEGKRRIRVKGKFLVVAVLVVVVVLALSGGGYIFAAGGDGSNSTDTKIAIIGDNVKMVAQSPLEVSYSDMYVIFDWEPNQANPVYFGTTLAGGSIVITNISPLNQAAYLYAEARNVDGDVWPQLEVTMASSNTIYWPWQQILIAPNASVTLSVEVKVAYGGPMSSFNGVNLIVQAAKPLVETCKGGCG